jgi:uncharacterized protein HemY
MEIAVGLILNVLFWVVVVTVAVYLLTWLGAKLFPVSTQRWHRVREGIRHPRGKEASSQASLTEETEEERHRKVA